MYAYLRGKLVAGKPTLAVVEVAGVGYEVQTTLITSESLPAPEAEVLLYIYPCFREDRVTLFGFATEEEKSVFTLLLSVAGVGPKLAQTILSGTTLEGLSGAILAGDEKTLFSIPGVGKKLAQRLLVELREPMAQRGGAFPAGPVSDLAGEAVGALVTLGYPRTRAFSAVQRACEAAGRERPTLEALIKEALKLI